MQTLTEIVAAVVVHSSAAAYSHFGVALEAPRIEHPAPAERVIARTAAPKRAVKAADRLQKASDRFQKDSDCLDKASDALHREAAGLAQKAQAVKT